MHRYLFLMKEDEIEVYETSHKTFERILRQGEIKSAIDEEFFGWWVNEVAYNSKQDKCDICLLYDKEYPIVLDKVATLNRVERSIWTPTVIEKLFDVYPRGTRVTLINEDNEYTIQIRSFNFKNKQPERFYTNCKLMAQKVVPKDTATKECSAMARYFKNKRQEDLANKR